MNEWICSTKTLKKLASADLTQYELCQMLIKNRTSTLFHYLIDQNKLETFDQLLELLQNTCNSPKMMELLWFHELSNNKDPFCIYSNIKALLPILLNHNQRGNRHWHVMILAQVPAELQSMAVQQAADNQFNVDQTLNKYESYLKQNGLMQTGYGVLISKVKKRVQAYELQYGETNQEVQISEVTIKSKPKNENSQSRGEREQSSVKCCTFM